MERRLAWGPVALARLRDVALYPVSRTWSEREAIDPVHAERTGEGEIDIDAEGRATAGWHEIGASGSWEVMTNRFE